MFFFVAFLIFSGALFGVAYYAWMMPRKAAATDLDIRLRSVRSTMRSAGERGATDLVQREKRGTFAALGDFVSWLGVVNRLQVLIRQANLSWRAADVVAICAGIAILSYLVFMFLIPIFLLRLLLAAILAFIPVLIVMRKRRARISKFEQQLPDAIDLFTRTMRELALGSAIDPALHKLGERMPILDLKFFITGLILQRQTGANMVGVLEDLATLVRERLNMAGKMRAHTASQRFSAGLLCALPFVVGLGFFFLKPEYVRLLWTDPLGTKFLTYAIISEIVGILVIRQLSNIKV
jgi:tight adherence protein B